MVKFLGVGMDYEIRAIANDIDYPDEPGRRNRSLHHLKTIEEAFSEFESGLKGKEIPTEYFDAYRRAVEVLRNYFDSEGTKIKRTDADIHYFYLVEKHKKFREVYGESAEE